VNPLYARWPALVDRLPWRPLGVFPTPVERAPAFGDDVWVKRDDATGGESYGGNKVRKLEWLLADALARGRRSVLTIGGTGSNHVLATAIYAHRVGLAHIHAILFPQPASDDVIKKRDAFSALDVRVSRAIGKATVPFAAIARVVASLATGGGWPYTIGPGGSSPLGTLGYVAAALELAEQIRRGELPEPETIWVPLGSGGTVAGLIAGLRVAKLSTRVVAVRVVPYPWTTAGGARSLATRVTRLLARAGADLPSGADRFRASDLDVIHDQLGPGYGAPTDAAIAAVARARDAGLTLETTYTGKTLAALLAARPRRALLWNTYSPTTIATTSANVAAR
jgi:D-cysteine desulfhydrase